jgi:hypothetical protein
MFEYGRSVLEPVYILREWAPKLTTPGANRKQYTMLKKLGFRPESTIVGINYDDNGGPATITHNAMRADNKTERIDIPIEKLAIFTFEGNGSSLDGESILRSAYEHWFYKRTLYKIDAIQKERHGIGVPEVELLPGHSPNDKAIAHELARNLRTNEYAYIVRPSTLRVGFAELSGNLVNVLESASHHDLQIMKNVLIQFLEVDISGTRATSATSADIFMKVMRYVGSYICEIINQFVVPNLVAYNFDTDEFPQLKVRNIGEVKDLQMWAAAMSNLVDKEIITMDDESEDFVREVVQWPKKLKPRPKPANSSPGLTGGNTAGGSTNGNNPSGGKGRPTGPNSIGRTTGNINKGTLSGI